MKKPPIIDPLQFVNGPSDLVREIFVMLGQQLPEASININKAFAEKKPQKISDELHKLQGSCAYCGLPRLKIAVTAFYQAIKKKQPQQQENLNLLNREIQAVIKELRKKGF